MKFKLLPFTPPLLVPLPTVHGNVDYRTFRLSLETMDALLRASGLEAQFVGQALERWLAQSSESKVTAKPQLRFEQQSRQALRCNLLRSILQLDFRGLAERLADSPLLQWFIGIAAWSDIRVPSKSQLQRYAEWLPAEQIKELITQLLQTASQNPAQLQLEQPLDLDAWFLDTTCLKAHIHFPVDWVLFRDATRTLMKATRLIRGQGLKQRMEEPAAFLGRMNKLCLQMTHARRAPDSKKRRKKTVRQMKTLLKTIEAHARRHRQLLDENWAQTDWTRKQAEQILARLDRVLEQLPAAVKQAHERIIGERPVKNADKVLSLYEASIHVLVRGKAGAEVEFGNTLSLAESPAGLILDWQLFEDQAPADARLLKPAQARLEKAFPGQLQALGADRGFDSAANRQLLKEKEIYNGICPKAPVELKERMQEERFAGFQTRRSQTEGRIAILKHNFLGQPLRVKGFPRRELAVGWGVLAHNLWVLARLRISQAETPAQAEAA